LLDFSVRRTKIVRLTTKMLRFELFLLYSIEKVIFIKRVTELLPQTLRLFLKSIDIRSVDLVSMGFF